KKFGNIYFQVNGYDSLKIISNKSDIKDACLFFLSIGFDITDINYIKEPLSPEQIKKFIQNRKNEQQRNRQMALEKFRQKKTQEKSIYDNQKLIDTKKVVEWLFEKITNIRDKAKSTISTFNLKKLNELEESLKKLRMGTNYEKLKENIQDIFDVIDDIDSNYYKQMQGEEKTVIKNSVVTNFDIRQFFDKLEEAKEIKKFGGNLSAGSRDYIVFGKLTMFWNFFQSDFLNKIKNLKEIFFNLYDIFEFGIIIIIFQISIYIFLNYILNFSQNIYYIYLTLINLGFLGIVLFFAKFFRKNNFGRLLILIPLILIAYYLLINFFSVNFAL
ncbi:MAG: hypothetical protein WC872_03765, partial [Candidatus Absconditabacterales bacterium]